MQSETLAKVRWLASEYQKKVPIIYSLKSKISKESSFEPDKVQIKLKDGIPNDPKEEAEIAAIWYSAGAMSTEAMLEARGLKEGSEAFDKELARLKAAQPVAPEAPVVELPGLEAMNAGQPAQ